MDLSIVILNYKSRGLVKQCVKTIGLVAPKLQYEIIVVDNDSQDGTGAMLEASFPHVKFIASPANVGYAGGNNLGIAASCGRYVMVMNPDITVRPGALDAMVEHMDANRDIGVLGPKLMHPDGTLDESCFRFPSPMIPVYRRTPLGRTAAGREALASYVMRDFDRAATRDVDWLLGAALLVRREALAEVGPLDDRFFLYLEDTDWCRRFLAAGWRVTYFAGATMVHYHDRLSARGSWLTSPLRKSTRIHISSAIKYFRKWGTATAIAATEKAGA
jgi:GT2 family glycosyltransferase